MPTSDNSHNAATDDRGLGLALLLLFVGAFLRCPYIFIHGRMWAEELTIFLLGSWNHSFVSALQAPHFGYFSVWDNALAAIAVHWIPLTCVALLFTWSSIANLLLTGYLVFQAEFLRNRTAKTLGVLTLLMTSPCVEAWLNVLNSEFYFGIWAGVILVSDASRLRLQRHLALLLAVLSGPLTTLLAPLYVLRAILGRQRGQITQAAVVCLGGLAQIGVAILSSMANRKVGVSPLILGPVLFNRNIVLVFFSRIAAKRNYFLMHDILHFNSVVFLGSWVALILALTGFFLLSRNQKAAAWLLFIALWFTVLETTMALQGGLEMAGTAFGERYAFTPNYFIELALVVLALQATASPRCYIARLLLACAFCAGTVEYLVFPLRDQTDWKEEPWRQQILRWQQDPSIPLRASPGVWLPQHLPPRQ